MRQPQRRPPGGGLLVEEALERRRGLVFVAAVAAGIVGAGVGAATQRACIGTFVERVEGTQTLAVPGIDQLDA